MLPPQRFDKERALAHTGRLGARRSRPGPVFRAGAALVPQRARDSLRWQVCVKQYAAADAKCCNHKCNSMASFSLPLSLSCLLCRASLAEPSLRYALRDDGLSPFAAAAAGVTHTRSLALRERVARGRDKKRAE